MGKTFSERFEAELLRQKLILPGDKVLVACSGGPDSVALFHLLHALRERWRLKLGLIHLNHGLRGRAAVRDAEFVRRLARKNHVPVFVGKSAVKKMAGAAGFSLEEAARKARYDFFQETAKRCRISKIALAHTQDDQAETILMRILQGTGLRGLCGIRPRLKMGGVVFVRPLLSFPKKELLGFLRKEKIPFCSDATNRSKRFLRNQIRLELIPWLAKEINPKVVDALARIPAIVGEETQLLSELEKTAFRKIVGKFCGGKLSLRRNDFLELPPALQFRILERALKKMDPRSGVSFEAWQRLRGVLSQKRCRYSLPRDIDLILTPLKMALCKKNKQK